MVEAGTRKSGGQARHHNAERSDAGKRRAENHDANGWHNFRSDNSGHAGKLADADEDHAHHPTSSSVSQAASSDSDNYASVYAWSCPGNNIRKDPCDLIGTRSGGNESHCQARSPRNAELAHADANRSGDNDDDNKNGDAYAASNRKTSDPERAPAGTNSNLRTKGSDDGRVRTHRSAERWAH